MTRQFSEASERHAACIIVQQYRPDDAGATRDVFDRAVRCTAARSCDPAQVEAWAGS